MVSVKDKNDQWQTKCGFKRTINNDTIKGFQIGLNKQQEKETNKAPDTVVPPTNQEVAEPQLIVEGDVIPPT